MRKILFSAIVLITVLAASTSSLAAARFKVLAPAEESFIGASKVLIIGQVDGISDAKMVEVLDNGKAVGFAPLRNKTFTYSSPLADGRHEITLTAPGIETRTIKIFVGKQKGYKYHIEPDLGSCGGCHPRADQNIFSVDLMQGEVCGQCHDDMGTKEFVHGPVAASSCTPCHDPHGSRHERFLVALGKELCLVCHSQNLSKKHIEERQNADCVKCHDPHSSAKEYHLR